MLCYVSTEQRLLINNTIVNLNTIDISFNENLYYKQNHHVEKRYMYVKGKSSHISKCQSTHKKDEFKISAVEEFKADVIQIIKTNKDLFADTDT